MDVPDMNLIHFTGLLATLAFLYGLSALLLFIRNPKLAVVWLFVSITVLCLVVLAGVFLVGADSAQPFVEIGVSVLTTASFLLFAYEE